MLFYTNRSFLLFLIQNQHCQFFFDDFQLNFEKPSYNQDRLIRAKKRENCGIYQKEHECRRVLKGPLFGLNIEFWFFGTLNVILYQSAILVNFNS